MIMIPKFYTEYPKMKDAFLFTSKPEKGASYRYSHAAL